MFTSTLSGRSIAHKASIVGGNQHPPGPPPRRHEVPARSPVIRSTRNRAGGALANAESLLPPRSPGGQGLVAEAGPPGERRSPSDEPWNPVGKSSGTPPGSAVCWCSESATGNRGAALFLGGERAKLRPGLVPFLSTLDSFNRRNLYG